MVKEIPSETQLSAVGWAQDQLYQLKAQVAALEQQLEQFQLLATTLGDRVHALEGSLHETSLSASQTPRLQEELNQAVALVVQLQDQQAETIQRLDELGRSRGLDDDRDQEEWSEIVRRTEQLERQVNLWNDRQSGMNEGARRQQEHLSIVREQLQQIEQRLGTAEGKAAKGMDGANRAEHAIKRMDATIESLKQQDAAVTERVRATADSLSKLEHTIEKHLDELKRLELLAERIELHRAERQRLEDRALRLEEELQALQGRADQGEQMQGKLGTQQQGLSSRLDALQEQVQEQRGLLVEQIRKLTATQDRTKRRQVQELERELREMKQYVADLTRE